MSTIDSPIPLSDIEGVLSWVDTFKLSRPTRKINRDFSDAVLLAEILSVHYPKLVEMHNYPPRNSHALKLNNWMTLNRKVLKKLRLNLCCNTMDQLANCAPGVIERVLIMVRDKIRRDEELNRSMKDAEQNMSSGGSYYEACGDDDHVLVVPVKTRVNGVLETIQQKVISYETYLSMKEELKDANDSVDQLKQKVGTYKVEHLNDLLKLKEERIEELQTHLERKQLRRKEAEALQNSLGVPFDTVPSPHITDILPISQKASLKTIECNNITTKFSREESKIPILRTESGISKTMSKPSVTEVSPGDIIKIQSNNIVHAVRNDEINVDLVKSDVFQDVVVADEKTEETQLIKTAKKKSEDVDIKNDNFSPDSLEIEEFKDSSQEVITIEESIKKEIKDIITPSYNAADLNYII